MPGGNRQAPLVSLGRLATGACPFLTCLLPLANIVDFLVIAVLALGLAL